MDKGEWLTEWAPDRNRGRTPASTTSRERSQLTEQLPVLDVEEEHAALAYR